MNNLRGHGKRSRPSKNLEPQNATYCQVRGSKLEAILPQIRERETMKAFLVIGILFLSGCTVFAQVARPSGSGGIGEVYLAKDDGSGKAGEQVTEFGATDIPIYCVVLLASGEKSVVKMQFVAVNVAGVKPETKVVTASYTTKNGQNRVNFSGRPEGKWTPGKYRVDLFLDGKKTIDIDFIINGSTVDTSAVKFFQTPRNPKSKRKTDK